MKLIDHEGQPLEVWRPGVVTRMRISRLTGAEALTVFEQWCETGVGAPTHWHPVEEVLTVLSGCAELWLEDEQQRLQAGQSVVVPPRRRHGFRNAGDGELRMLAILAAPIFEAHFDDRAEISRRWFER